MPMSVNDNYQDNNSVMKGGIYYCHKEGLVYLIDDIVKYYDISYTIDMHGKSHTLKNYYVRDMEDISWTVDSDMDMLSMLYPQDIVTGISKLIRYLKGGTKFLAGRCVLVDYRFGEDNAISGFLGRLLSSHSGHAGETIWKVRFNRGKRGWEDLDVPEKFLSIDYSLTYTVELD